MLFQRVAKRNGVENGNAAPCGLRVVVQAAVVAEHVFAPPEELFRRVQILLVAGRVRHVHHRIDRVVAAAVNDLAGGTENGAVEVRISRHGNLQMDQLVAPCLQQVEDFALKLVFRDGHGVVLFSYCHSGMDTQSGYIIPDCFNQITFEIVLRIIVLSTGRGLHLMWPVAPTTMSTAFSSSKSAGRY